MDRTLKVSCICPSNRPQFVANVIACFIAQKYPNKELLILNDNGDTSYTSVDNGIFPWSEGAGLTIGTKRNILCEYATGDIIINFDDDDFYAPNYISQCVAQLQTAKVTGFSSAYFYKPHTSLYLYQYKGSQPYVLESGMAFWRSVWDKNKFADSSNGEGLKFITNSGLIRPHRDISTFIAMLHENNTQTGKDMSIFKPQDISLARTLLGESYYLW